MQKPKRKYLKIVNTVLFFILLSLGTVKNLNAAWQGSGTETDPWQITSRQCLEALADSVNNANTYLGEYFILMNDITDSVRTIIGHQLLDFKGNFEGNDKKITSAMNMNTPNPTEIRNASVFHNNKGLVANLQVDGYAVNHNNHCGSSGIVSNNYNTVTNCINYATIINYNQIGAHGSGGMVIYNVAGVISDCINNGMIVGTNSVGGIAALNLGNGIIVNCMNISMIKGNNSIGGIVGWVSKLVTEMGTVINNTNYGFIKGHNNVGGVAGMLFDGATENNFNSGVVEGTSNVGCIVGLNNGGTVINNHYDKQMCGDED